MRTTEPVVKLPYFSTSKPATIFLGSYPRADKQRITVVERYDNDAFVDARDWLRGLIAGER